MNLIQAKEKAEYILRLSLAADGIPVDDDKLARAVERLAADLMRHVESCSPAPEPRKDATDDRE